MIEQALTEYTRIFGWYAFSGRKTKALVDNTAADMEAWQKIPVFAAPK